MGCHHQERVRATDCWLTGEGPGRVPWPVQAALLLLLAVAPAACRSEPHKSWRLRVGMMPKLVGISYFDATEQGAREAAAELGIDLLYDGPTTASAEEQAQMIDSWVAQGVDVIAVAPNDPESIGSTLQAARRAGVHVLTWDTDANPETSGRTVFVNQAPSQAIGQMLVEIMAEGVKRRHGNTTGKFLIVSGTPTAANQNTWMAIMRRHIARHYPDMELLPVLTPGEDQNRAREQTAEALQAHPDLRGIWGITSVALPAAAKAVQDAGRAEQVYVTGLSLPSLMRSYVKDGVVEKFILWDAVDLGYLTVHVAVRLAQGTLSPGTFDFGRLKGIQVTPDEVILGPPLVFTRENIDQYRF